MKHTLLRRLVNTVVTSVKCRKATYLHGLNLDRRSLVTKLFSVLLH